MRRIFPIAIVALFFVIAWQSQAIADWWFLRSYEPSEEIVRLADESYMSDRGRDLFYLSDPQINDKDSFNDNCPIIEESFVLGCYASGRIYILAVDRDELDGIMEVTAAHEMLHKAYDRLSEADRLEVVGQLEDFYAGIEDEALRDLIDRYEQRGGQAIRENELHSILPTQIEELPSELEAYYEQYFTDRSAVAELYRSYESVFIELNQRIESLKVDIRSLRGEINTLEQQIVVAVDLVESLNRQLDRYEEEEDTESYNELVPEQNEAVSRYNSLLDTHRQRISEHNRLVDQVNEIVLYQADLVNSMDSRFQPL